MPNIIRHFFDFLWKHEISADLDLFDYLGCCKFCSVIQLFNQMVFLPSQKN